MTRREFVLDNTSIVLDTNSWLRREFVLWVNESSRTDFERLQTAKLLGFVASGVLYPSGGRMADTAAY